MASNILQEYLVKVGFDADNASFKTLQNKLGVLQQALGKFSTTMAGKATIAASGLTLALTGLTAAVTAFSASMAQSDIQVEILARRLLTTERNARSLKAVMEAMNLKSLDELQDINLNPELRRQFIELRNLSSSLEPGQDVQRALADIRAVGYAFQRLQVIISYSFLTIAGKISGYLQKPMGALIRQLGRFEDWFLRNFDKITDWIAKILANVIQLFASLVGFMVHFGKLVTGAGKLFTWLQKTPGVIQSIGLAMAALAVTVMPMVTAVSALLLLLDDYMVYKMGGISLFGNYYDDFERLGGAVFDIVKNIDNNLQKLIDLIFGKGAASSALNIGRNAIGEGIKAAPSGIFLPSIGGVGAAIGRGINHAISSGIMKEIQGEAAPSGAQAPATPFKKMIGQIRKISNAVRLSPQLEAFNQALARNVSGVWGITSGIRGSGGPRSHASGNKEDIALNRRSDAEILALMWGLSQTPGFVFGGLEALGTANESSSSRIKRLIKEFTAMGGNPRQFGDYTSKRTTGPHLDVLIDPKVYGRKISSAGGPGSNVTININGSNDPQTIAAMVMDRINQLNNTTMRGVRSAYV